MQQEITDKNQAKIDLEKEILKLRENNKTRVKANRRKRKRILS